MDCLGSFSAEHNIGCNGEHHLDYLRSTKWNASLILACDSAVLVALCKVMFWKTHIPVRIPKWPQPRLTFSGPCHSIFINYVTA